MPPVGKLGAGPSGFAAYPGVGLPDRYRYYLFYCNFTSMGGVEAFTLRASGAGFKIQDLHKVISPVNATDVDFGYDGRMYISDFGKLEWDGSNTKGRIYRIEAPESKNNSVVNQVAKLFREGFGHRSDAELLSLLDHQDMRVRLRCQYSLAERGPKVMPDLAKIAHGSPDRFARLHTIWGIGQIGRQSPEALGTILDLVHDVDPVIRAQVAKVLGEGRFRTSLDALVRLLRDENDHVKLAAAIAVGKLRDPTTIEALIDFLRRNDDRDPFLRHAGIVGLLGAGGKDASARLLRDHGADSSVVVRMAVLLVCRREGNSEISRFLKDPDISLVTEAARAINDLALDTETPKLAGTLSHVRKNTQANIEPLIRRTINANFRVGGVENAQSLIDYASDVSQPIAMREEALAALAAWNDPPPRDRVNGFWGPLPKRDPSLLRGVVSATIPTLLASTSPGLLVQAIELIDRSGAIIGAAPFQTIVADSKADVDVRLSALRLLGDRKVSDLSRALKNAIESGDPGLRSEGLKILAREDHESAIDQLGPIVKSTNAPLLERQRGLETLARLPSTRVDALIVELISGLATGKVPPDVHLELLESAKLRNDPEIREALLQYEAGIVKDPLGSSRSSLFGGDSVRGRAIFTDNTQAQCIRCHKISDKGGTTGPELTQVAGRHDREGLLRSLVDPDAEIAQGFGTVTLALRDGRVISGLVKAEDAHVIQVEISTEVALKVPVEEVEERTNPRSQMPRIGSILSPRELRDLMAYLASLK